MAGPTAFQPNGFQVNAFQIGTGNAFQCDAFQVNAFQMPDCEEVPPEPEPPVVGEDWFASSHPKIYLRGWHGPRIARRP